MSVYDRVVQELLPDVEYHQNRYARELDQLVAPGTRWLDLGTGSRLHGGWIGARPAELVARRPWVIGCDLDASHLRQNRELSAACVGDGGGLPFAERSFDLVTANMVVEHLPDPEAVFREVARVLRYGGIFLFLTPNRRHPAVCAARALFGRSIRRRLAVAVEHRAQEHVFPTFYRANSIGDLQRIAGAAGLVVQRLESFSSYPFIRRFLPLTLAECLWIRATGFRALAPFRSNLLGRLQSVPPSAPAD
jgi:ubiquinone/menaquinone biosynthesis C-methylase UbiE